ncbi:hypothetical protein [Pyxidicoccus sp. MSG2]|uniref:hypothetical protein n=1 Tax=Pyxidicoccus sp. MSG2 TaxID=2996790 RepID=UPI0022708255|nr:hypothetical protein [Pyxidicoccus sp. MSG2]MCY1019269.1 hypothetical protein [Pyxidicoccus sp. MSG2]
MSFEYVIAGRRALPPHEGAWVYYLEHDEDEVEDEDGEEDEFKNRFDEGSLESCEILPKGNDEFFAEVERLVGFVPAVVITIDPAAWEVSTLVAEVLAEALDGVMYCDGLVNEFGLEYVPTAAASAVSTIDELEARIFAAYEDPKPYVTRRAERGAARQAEADARDPVGAAKRAAESDWGDV